MKRETEKKIYECLGVNIFRKGLLLIDAFTKLIHLDLGYKIKDKTIEGLKDFRKIRVKLGITHIILLPFAILPFVPTISWVLLNVYCVMVQRYDYIRADEIIKKYEKRKLKPVRIPVEEKETATKEEQVNIIEEELVQKTEHTLHEMQSELEHLYQLRKELYSTNEESNNATQEHPENGFCKRMKKNMGIEK